MGIEFRHECSNLLHPLSDRRRPILTYGFGKFCFRVLLSQLLNEQREGLGKGRPLFKSAASFRLSHKLLFRYKFH